MAIMAAMRAVGVKFLGLYDEITDKFQIWTKATIGTDLEPFRRVADAIEASGLNYTILRLA